MNMKLIKFCICLFVATLVFVNADAQRTPKKRKDSNPANTNPPSGNEQQQNNNNQPPAGYDPNANLPVTYDTTSNDITPKKSLRNDNAFDKGSLTQRTPLIYEHLRWDDALYAEKVWRELDLREKVNKVFQYDAQDDNGSQMFINILLKAVNSGEVTAFADDRFTTPMNLADIQQLTMGTADTVAQTDVNNPNIIVKYVVTRASFDPKSVMKIRIKEEWVFDRESSRMFCRILGISPMKTVMDQRTGKERGISQMFWVYYPDLRPILARYEVYNPKNKS